jgi:predicted acyltransferase
MRSADVPLALQTRRIVSVDALRGFSIFWIIGGDGAVLALDRMLKDKGQPLRSISGFLATQMSHVPWEGFSFYDFVFPLFLFVTGVSIVLALPRIVENEGKAQAHLGVLRRALTLYLLGVIFYGHQPTLEPCSLCRHLAADRNLLPVCGAPVINLIGAD